MIRPVKRGRRAAAHADAKTPLGDTVEVILKQVLPHGDNTVRRIRVQAVQGTGVFLASDAWVSTTGAALKLGAGWTAA